jgi:hypothetical protein
LFRHPFSAYGLKPRVQMGRSNGGVTVAYNAYTLRLRYKAAMAAPFATAKT